VTAVASVTAVEGRTVSFAVELSDDAGPIGRGTHRRAIIDRAKFDARVAAKAALCVLPQLDWPDRPRPQGTAR
jgi:fluoroacetyl-CoA thioesterase